MFTRVSQHAQSLLRRYYFFIYAYNLMLNCLCRGRNRHAGILPSGPLDRKVRLVTAWLECSVPAISDARPVWQ